MNLHWCFLKRRILIPSVLVATLAQMVIGSLRLQAQGTPDIVWVTNVHGFSVTSVAFSGDSLSLASGSLDGSCAS